MNKYILEQAFFLFMLGRVYQPCQFEQVLQHFRAVCQWCFLHRFNKHLFFFHLHTIYDIVTQKKNACANFCKLFAQFFHHYWNIQVRCFPKMCNMSCLWNILIYATTKWIMRSAKICDFSFSVLFKNVKKTVQQFRIYI